MTLLSEKQTLRLYFFLLRELVQEAQKELTYYDLVRLDEETALVNKGFSQISQLDISKAQELLDTVVTKYPSLKTDVDYYKVAYLLK